MSVNGDDGDVGTQVSGPPLETRDLQERLQDPGSNASAEKLFSSILWLVPMVETVTLIGTQGSVPTSLG